MCSSVRDEVAKGVVRDIDWFAIPPPINAEKAIDNVVRVPKIIFELMVNPPTFFAGFQVL